MTIKTQGCDSMLNDLILKKMDEKGWAVYYLHRVTIKQDPNSEGVSTTQINKILNRQVREPTPSLLKKLAKALDIPWRDMLIAAGYAAKHDLVEDQEKDKDPEILDLLESIENLSPANRQMIINTIKTMMKGMT